ncbi:MAG: 3-oxoacyl-[acyl-carrier-protein] reductase FabG [Gammaproteobacteria bacterium]|nr:3-oxoacyl-[acyl-carrier-protein] reductase FabG [Gammaproteobacteria bacterium]
MNGPARANWYHLGERSAVVTGGARGLGLAIAERLAQANCRVHIFDLSVDDPAGLPGVFHSVDITDAGSVADSIGALDDTPTLLVNNAGITRDRTLLKMQDDEWQSVIDTNLTGSFNMIRALAPLMAAAGYGRIVNISSINGLRGKFGQANYTAAKAGLVGLTKTAARELGPKCITVNAVAPGMVETEMTSSLPPEIVEKARSETVSGHLANADDIADSVLFLLSEPAGAITGSVLKVDAGQYL